MNGSYYVHRASEAHPQGGVIGEAPSLQGAQAAAQEYEDMLGRDGDALEAYEVLALDWAEHPHGLRARSAASGQTYLITRSPRPPAGGWA